jgi:sterol desaturase/sphingolipid hydroxylase (fatty acid hydroxylase superfamily)
MDDLITKVVRFFKGLLTYQFNFHYFILFLSISITVILIELVVVGYHASSLKKIFNPNKSILTDIISWFIESFGFFRILSIILSFGICVYLVGIIEKSLPFKISLSINNVYLQFFIIYLVSDLKSYFRHFIFHKFKPLWPIHAFHHSSTNLTVLTRHRGHFLESEIGRFFDLIPFVLLGAPIESFFIVTIISELHQHLIHSEIRSDWGWFGKFIFVSPAAHRIHHSINSKHYNKNFGVTFIFWDHLFGTYHSQELVEEVGVKDFSFNKKGYFHDVLLVYKLFFIELIIFLKSIFQKNTEL